MLSVKDMWLTNFDEAVEVYIIALHSGSTTSHADRVAAAERFVYWIKRFKKGGKPALSVLQSELLRQNAYRRHAAARLLIEIGEPETLTRLSEAIVKTGAPQLKAGDLIRLWGIVTPSRTLLDTFANAGRWEQIPLIQVLLSRPTPEAVSLFNEIVGMSSWNLLDAAMKSIARWDDGQVLWKVVNETSNERILPEFGQRADIRTSAAFYLGLKGDSKALALLEDMANNSQAILAANACQRLSQLALPGAVKPIKIILSRNNAQAIAIALNAAAVIGVPALIPALLEVAERKIFTELYPSPVCDAGIRCLWQIIGYPLDLNEEYNPEVFPEEFTETFRRQAIARGQVAMQHLNPVRRYYSGELLTLNHLVDNLMSPHSGSVHAATYNLRAISGEDYGFDPDEDLISNIEAIHAWQRRVTELTVPEPGGWAFAGKHLNFSD